MVGDAFKMSDRQRDEIKWNCSAGPGMLTRYAPAEFTVTLRLENEERGDHLDLGLSRKPRKDSDLGEVRESWVPLIKNVTSLQISYFDSNTNAWLPKWPGGGRLPWLVKIEVGRPDSAVPWEAVIALRRTPY